MEWSSGLEGVMDTIDITNIPKNRVLAALFNASKQQGLGCFDPTGSKLMSADDAQAFIDEGATYFDYLHGRVMKVDLSSDELDPWSYDRDNGPGAARQAIESIR